MTAKNNCRIVAASILTMTAGVALWLPSVFINRPLDWILLALGLLFDASGLFLLGVALGNKHLNCRRESLPLESAHPFEDHPYVPQEMRSIEQ
jgi:hypothetical protein